MHTGRDEKIQEHARRKEEDSRRCRQVPVLPNPGLAEDWAATATRTEAGLIQGAWFPLCPSHHRGLEGWCKLVLLNRDEYFHAKNDRGQAGLSCFPPARLP
jgi:hypothetical protein